MSKRYKERRKQGKLRRIKGTPFFTQCIGKMPNGQPLYGIFAKGTGMLRGPYKGYPESDDEVLIQEFIESLRTKNYKKKSKQDGMRRIKGTPFYTNN